MSAHTDLAPDHAARLRRSLERIAPHDHVCLLFDSDEEQQATLGAFVELGLAVGDRCLCVADSGHVDRLSSALAGARIDVVRAAARGALALETERSTYLARGAFDPEVMCGVLTHSATAAARDGYRALRVAGEVTWALGGDPGSERVIEYETRVNTLLPGIPCLALCHYDRRRFAPAVLRDVIRTHPYALVKGRICRNHYYVPPTELLDTRGGARDVDRLLQNILERAQAEEELEEQERRLRLVLDGARHAFWDWDVEADLVTWDPRWKRLMGLAPEARPTIETWRERMHPDDRSGAVRAFRDHVEGRAELIAQEYRVRMGDGRYRWIASRGQVVERDPAGRPVRVAGTMTDVTEVHQLREQLELSSRLASLGTLAAGVAHEINNPLTFMNANLQWAIEELDARGGPGLGEISGALREALDGAERVARIVDGLRTLTRPAPAAASAPAELEKELRGAIHIAQRQVEERARLVVDLAPALPAVRVEPHQLGQVVVNLLVNAAQALPEGHAGEHLIEVSARADGGALVLEVHDSGPGIPPEVLPRIFDPFFTTKRAGAGSGLGLAICHQIVAAAGGTITAESTPGRGTTFRVRLPGTPVPRR